MDERGVWAGVVAVEAVWFLEDLKKGMVGYLFLMLLVLVK